jgi:hypothetical protein
MKPERVAIVAVHGIGPAQHYELQDQIAENLVEKLPGNWEREPFLLPMHEHTAKARNSGMRLRCVDHDAATYDIFEAYWSPIDKNRTKAISVFTWLFNAIFAPLNATTPLPATGAKLAFDVLFVVTAIGLAFVLPIAAIFTGAFVYENLSSDLTTGHMVSALTWDRAVDGNLRLLSFGLHPLMLLAYALAIFGWYTIYYAIESAIVRLPHGQREFQWQRALRVIAVAVGSCALVMSWMMPAISDERFRYRYEPLLLLAVVLMARFAFFLVHDFFVNRIGDIQIYTTGNENSVYYDLHNRILDTVSDTVLRVLQAQEHGQPLYDRVVIIAHSLGSTIAMDALLRLRQAVKGGALPEHMWSRISAFVTIGTALEKTRFFFAVRRPTFSESFEQWRNDVYGDLFTRDPAALRKAAPRGEHAIFWANYWYLRDVVANRIVTYRSSANGDPTHSHSICYNVRLQERGRTVLARPWVHSDYVGDVHFWDGIDKDHNQRIGALEVITTSPA